MRSLVSILLFLATLLPAAPAAAILKIEITQGVEGGIPIAVVPFKPPKGAPLSQDVAAIVRADLARSGRFSPLAVDKLPATPTRDRDVVYKDWRLVKVDALVIGDVQRTRDGRYQIEFRLIDVYKQRQLTGYRYVVGEKRLRAIAHQIADRIYEKLTGEPGVFNTRIAYVSRQGAGKSLQFQLNVADSDGYNPVAIVTSPEPLMSPAWSPDGKQIAYVSFEAKRSMIYLQSVVTGKRERLAQFPGINSAPAFSPDGRRLAMALSRDGNAEIYIMDLKTRALQRLTFDPAIDTEPTWSPDGRQIIFTSDRAGGPQLYRKPATGGAATRLTFQGNYNARARYAPDGKSIAFVTRHHGRYNIGVMDLHKGTVDVLTSTRLDESPSFAPNGSMILYATEIQGRGVLASVSADGRVRQLYTLADADIREPAWSPYLPR
jgi:TolB protein